MKNVRAKLKTSIKNEDINFIEEREATKEQIKDLNDAFEYLVDMFGKYDFTGIDEYAAKKIIEALDDAIYYIEDNVMPTWWKEQYGNKNESIKVNGRKRNLKPFSERMSDTSTIKYKKLNFDNPKYEWVVRAWEVEKGTATLCKYFDKEKDAIDYAKSLSNGRFKNGRVNVSTSIVYGRSKDYEYSEEGNGNEKDITFDYVSPEYADWYGKKFGFEFDTNDIGNLDEIKRKSESYRNTKRDNRLNLNEKYYLGYGESSGDFYGVDGVEFIYKGEWSDPLIAYNGYILNASIIEDALYDEFVEYTGDKYTGEVDDNYFDSWVGENPDVLINILNDYIEGYNFPQTFDVDYLIKTKQTGMLGDLADEIAYDSDGKRKIFGEISVNDVKKYYGNKKFTLDDFYTLPYLG